MAADPPLTDSRRASQLREALTRSAPMLAPDWVGLRKEGDFGRALVEIAARLAEHSTSRLDRTALRDKLAFLEALDVATPPPQSATAPIVFTLAEKRGTPVSAPARVQLTAKPGKADKEGEEDLTFETREAIDISPARLAELIVADPAADRIERAPGFVTRGLESDAPAINYRLLSAVETGSDALQLVQAVGIDPEDLLRLGGIAYRVETLDGNIVRLRDRLTGPSPAGARVEKLIALEAFELRNLQEHAVYVGHKELLKLDGPAEINLRFRPADAAVPHRRARRRISDLGDPGRRRRSRLAGARPGRRRPGGAAPGQGLAGQRRRARGGPAGKSRWLRIRLRTPIAGACGPATGALSVQLQVRSAAPPQGETEGSGTIAAAFYNGQPLPTSTAFFPFGPEPQRFDIFSLSAPEALSKKGARVTLDFKLDDASLRSMAYDPAAPDHVYGISVNGRLQSIRFAQSVPAVWRPLGLAAADGAAPGEGSVRLDPGAPPYVLRIGATLDLVFVRGKDEAIRVARVGTTDGNVAVIDWQSLAHPAGKPFAAFCLIPAPAAGLSQADGLLVYRRAAPTLPLAYLLAADSDGFYSQAIGFGGVPAGGWTQLQSTLAPGEEAALALAGGNSDDAVVVAIDAAGALHRGALDLARARIDWTALNSKGAKAATTVQPLAYLDQEALVVAAARKAGDASPSPLIVVGRDPPAGDLAMDLGEVGSFAHMPASDAGDAPLILVTGERGVLIWSGDESEIAGLPAEADPKGLRALLLPPAESPKLLLAVGSELVLEGSASSGRTQVSVEFSDLLHRDPDSPVPSHALIKTDDDRMLDPLEATWLPFEDRLVQPALRTDGNSYLLLEDMGEPFPGTRIEDRRLQLDGADLDTRVDDIIAIGGKTYAVTAKTALLVDLDADLPAGPNLDYEVYRPIRLPAAKFLKADRKRFAKPAKPAAAPVKFLFSGPIAPKNQEIVEAHGDWLLLKKPWTTVPAGTTAQAALFTLPGLAITAQIRLPRESDNPDLSWEYFDGDGWQRLDKWGLIDRTGNFARTGTVTFTVPPALAPTEIAGKEDYWLRVRLIGGDYGRPTYDIVSQPPIQQDPPKPVRSTTSITIDRSRLNPPEIISVEAGYVLERAVPPDRVVADNNLASIDQTQAALARGAVFDLFEGIAQHVADPDGGTRALYLGFGRAPGVTALNIYADAVDRDHPPGELVAESLTPSGWRKIDDADETAALTRPGMLRLFLTPPPEQLPLFGIDGWWLRLRPKRDAARWAPKLRGFFVNAVMAEHAKSISQEISGLEPGRPEAELPARAKAGAAAHPGASRARGAGRGGAQGGREERGQGGDQGRRSEPSRRMGALAAGGHVRRPGRRRPGLPSRSGDWRSPVRRRTLRQDPAGRPRFDPGLQLPAGRRQRRQRRGAGDRHSQQRDRIGRAGDQPRRRGRRRRPAARRAARGQRPRLPPPYRPRACPGRHRGARRRIGAGRGSRALPRRQGLRHRRSRSR